MRHGVTGKTLHANMALGRRGVEALSHPEDRERGADVIRKTRHRMLYQAMSEKRSSVWDGMKEIGHGELFHDQPNAETWRE